MSMNDAFSKVREFHRAMGHPASEEVSPVQKSRREARGEWLKEEIEEWVQSDDLVGQLDALMDLIYLTLGGMVEVGVAPSDIFGLVHEANMAKIWPDGRSRHRADGKVIKPPAWEGPEQKIAAYLEMLRASAS